MRVPPKMRPRPCPVKGRGCQAQLLPEPERVAASLIKVSKLTDSKSVKLARTVKTSAISLFQGSSDLQEDLPMTTT